MVTTPAARGRLGPWPGHPARGVGPRHRRWSRVRLALDPCARPHGEAPPAAPASWEPPWDGRACGPGQAGARRASADKAAVMSWWLQSQYEERLAGAAGATQPPVWLSPASGHPPPTPPTPCPFAPLGICGNKPWKLPDEDLLVTQREGFRGQESNSFPEKTKPSGRGPGGLP